MSIADQIAGYVSEAGYADFDPLVVERAKDLCLSSIGSAVLGARMEVPAIMADYARATGRPAGDGPAGGPGLASVIGFGFSAPAELAAMMNCISSHCTELEDVAWPEAQYTCCLLPALLSLGQALGSSGREVLEAIIIGFEVAARPGMICSNHGAAARGFLSCANNGTIGVAAGAARLMKLDAGQIRDAVTLATSVGGGLVRQTGSAAHVVEAGFAGRDGIMAATLAARGIGGNPTIMDGKAGYYDALAGQPEIRFSLGTGRDLRIMAVGQKKYPCCYLLQRIIDQLKMLVARHDIAPDAVAEVVVEVNRAFPTIVKYPTPKDVEEARFSLPHVVAGVLVGEPMDVQSFSAAGLRNPAIAAHRHKVRMVVHDDWGYDQLGKEDILTVRLVDGSAYRAVCTTARGDAEDPLTRDETIAKFRACAGHLLTPADCETVIACLTGFETMPSVAPLLELVAPISVAPAAAG